ncbi:MAG TPA: hypothetical protein VLG38_01750, partial [Gammaproteobacteria bacterium]|nr:hypothetical protein [Gammaproteobacteria bacterium]
EKEKSKIRKEMAKLAGSKTSEALQKRIYYTALLGQWDDMARLVALARKSNIPMPEELNSIDGVHLLHKLQMPMHKLFDFIELINLTPPKYVYEKMELTPQEMLEVLIRDVALRKYTKIMQDTAIKHVVGASGFSRDVRLFEQYFKCNGMAALRTRDKQALSDDRDPLHEVYKGYQAREALKLLKTSGLKLFSDILKELNVSLPDTAKKELYETEFLTAMANFATTDVRNFEFLMKKGNLQKVAAQASAMGTFDAHNLPKEHDFMELMTAVKEGRKLEKKLKFGKKG